MNKLQRTTFLDRIKNAINAFRDRPIGSVQYGIDIKRCDECEYKDTGYRDNLLVIAGARAAYMDSKDVIDIPEGVNGEDDYSYYVKELVDHYFNKDDVNFDEYIENALIKKYGKED